VTRGITGPKVKPSEDLGARRAERSIWVDATWRTRAEHLSDSGNRVKAVFDLLSAEAQTVQVVILFKRV
jgi:hypothetical protein